MWYSTEQDKSNTELASLELQIRRKTVLLRNATFLLQSKFRILLAGDLIGFVSNPDSDCELVYARLCEIFNRRSSLAALFVPSDQLKRAIRAAGFFLDFEAESQLTIRTTPSLRKIFLRLGFLKRWRPAGWAVLQASTRASENLQTVASAYQKNIIPLFKP